MYSKQIIMQDISMLVPHRSIYHTNRDISLHGVTAYRHRAKCRGLKPGIFRPNFSSLELSFVLDSKPSPHTMNTSSKPKINVHIAK